MRKLTFGDMRKMPRNPTQLAVTAWLGSQLAEMDYLDFRKLGSRQTDEYLQELQWQFAEHGEATVTESGWEITLAAPVMDVDVVQVRDPNTDDRESGGLPFGYAYNRKLLAAICENLSGGMIDRLSIGDAGFILATAFPELSSPFRG